MSQNAGPDGIIVPNVNSFKEAQKAVDYFKYPPLGKRGVGLARAQGYGFDFENYRDNKTKELKCLWLKMILNLNHFFIKRNFKLLTKYYQDNRLELQN